MIKLFFYLYVFFATADVYQRLCMKKYSEDNQVEPFQNFDKVQILEGSTVIISQTNEVTRAKMKYRNGD